MMGGEQEDSYGEGKLPDGRTKGGRMQETKHFRGNTPMTNGCTMPSLTTGPGVQEANGNSDHSTGAGSQVYFWWKQTWGKWLSV